jgi:hypothetical protein
VMGRNDFDRNAANMSTRRSSEALGRHEGTARGGLKCPHGLDQLWRS